MTISGLLDLLKSEIRKRKVSKGRLKNDLRCVYRLKKNKRESAEKRQIRIVMNWRSFFGIEVFCFLAGEC